MSLPSLEPRPWPRHRWWWLILVVFAAHLGFIFAFGTREAPVARKAGHDPTLRVTSGRSDTMTLEDPTLFALPHRRGFGTAVWLPAPRVALPPFRWVEPPRWLALAAEPLGEAFLSFMQTNTFTRFALPVLPQPGLTPPQVPPVGTTAPGQSTLEILDDLASRRWLNPVALPSWPGVDLLTNTVVRVWVDGPGSVISATLDRAGSGWKPADQAALAVAKAARFAPLPSPDSFLDRGLKPLTRGVLVFRWHTVPPAPTNAPPPAP